MCVGPNCGIRTRWILRKACGYQNAQRGDLVLIILRIGLSEILDVDAPLRRKSFGICMLDDLGNEAEISIGRRGRQTDFGRRFGRSRNDVSQRHQLFFGAFSIGWRRPGHHVAKNGDVRLFQAPDIGHPGRLDQKRGSVADLVGRLRRRSPELHFLGCQAICDVRNRRIEGRLSLLSDRDMRLGASLFKGLRDLQGLSKGWVPALRRVQIDSNAPAKIDGPHVEEIVGAREGISGDR